MADSTLDEVYCSEFLGMYFDRGLTWKLHIDHVCAKICSGIFVLITAYYGLIYPYLAYGVILWGSCANTQFQRAFRLQRKQFESSQKSNSESQDMHMYETRGRANYRSGRHRTMVYERLPSQAGVQFLNRLPNSIKDAPTPKAFKTRLKRFLKTPKWVALAMNERGVIVRPRARYERARAAPLCQRFAIGPHMLSCKCEGGVTIDLSGERQHRQTLLDYFLYDARRSDESCFFPRFSEQEPREPPAKLKKKDIVALKKLSDTQLTDSFLLHVLEKTFWIFFQLFDEMVVLSINPSSPVNWMNTPSSSFEGILQHTSAACIVTTLAALVTLKCRSTLDARRSPLVSRVLVHPYVIECAKYPTEEDLLSFEDHQNQSRNLGNWWLEINENQKTVRIVKPQTEKYFNHLFSRLTTATRGVTLKLTETKLKEEPLPLTICLVFDSCHNWEITRVTVQLPKIAVRLALPREHRAIQTVSYSEFRLGRTTVSYREFRLGRNYILTTYSPQPHNKIFKNQPAILMADSTLDEVYSSEFLGMYFDRGLTWKLHIDHVCAKICSGIFVLSQVLITAYYGLIYPYLAYGVILWGSCANTQFQRAFRLQRKQFESSQKSNSEKAKTYTCMRHVAEQTTELVDTERWFMNACLHKRVFNSSTDCPIQSKMLQRQRRLFKTRLKRFLVSQAFYNAGEFLAFNWEAAQLEDTAVRSGLHWR
ncbi:hypothetical protein J6590_089212 [Homalodisca vitripennis]|nr:hypothetical protein J6590_089212 [Homalodisca vitripennis]